MRGAALILALVLSAPALAAPQERPPALETIVALVEAGELVNAERELRRLLESGENMSARDLLGIVLMRQERFAEARQQIEMVVAADPRQAGPLQHLARLLLVQGDDVEALEHLRAAASLGNLERDLGLELASRELDSGNLDAAEHALRLVADRHDSVRALVQLARVRSQQGDPEGAHAVLGRALQLAPNSEEVLAAFARTSLAIRMPLPAIVSLEPLVRMHPSTARYAYLMGVTLMQLGDLDATDILTTAVALEPDHALSLIALGLAFNNQKRFAEAAPVLIEALRLDPESVEATAALAEAELGLGQLDEAERHVRRVLQRESRHGMASLVMGMILLERGNFAEARDSLRLAVEVDPDSHKGHYQLSLAYARLGDMDSSRRHLEDYRAALARKEEGLALLRSRLGKQPKGGMER